MNGIRTKVNHSTIIILLKRLELETNAGYGRKNFPPTYLMLDMINHISYKTSVKEIIFNYCDNKILQWSTSINLDIKLLTWNKFIEEVNNILEDK